jgi:hypothetical protein
VTVGEDLTADERRVLDYLMQPGGRVRETTTEEIGRRLGLAPPQARSALRVLLQLKHREPPLVRSEVDAGLDTEIWFTTPDAADAMDDTRDG